MEDEYILEEGGQSSSRRPFLLAVGVLLTIFVLAVACSAILLSSRGADTQTDEIAAIETYNAEIAITNTAVFMAATETAAAQPTSTPEPPPATDTPPPPPPTDTPAVTETPVVIKATEKAPETAVPTSEGGSTTVENTVTPASDSSSGNNNNSGSGTSNSDSLPQTGIETWGVILAALFLVVILITARRLRSG